MRADVTAKTIISDAINSLCIMSPFCRALVEKHLTAGNHVQGNSVLVRHCNDISQDLPSKLKVTELGPMVSNLTVRGTVSLIIVVTNSLTNMEKLRLTS